MSTSIDSLLDAFSSIDITSRSYRISKEEEKRINDSYSALIDRGKRSNEFREYSGEIWGFPIPQNNEELRLKRELSKSSNCFCKVAIYPFSKGAIRVAYHAEVRLEGESSWTKMIVKEFILEHDRTEKEYKSQCENSAISRYLCKKYCRERSFSKEIQTIHARVIKLRQPDGSTKLYNLEERLQGEFKKWTTNGGTILTMNKDIINLAKWSYDLSRGYLLLSDLQGVESSSTIILTDPAVLCTDLTRFGPTNFSVAQIQMCLDALNSSINPRLSSIRETIRAPGYSRRSDEYVAERLRTRSTPAPSIREATPPRESPPAREVETYILGYQPGVRHIALPPGTVFLPGFGPCLATPMGFIPLGSFF